MNTGTYKTLSIVIPVYNEESTVANIVDVVRSVDAGLAKGNHPHQ